MKMLFMILFVFFAGRTTYAQDIARVNAHTDTLPVVRDSAMKEYLSLQAGQMFFVQNNKVSRMKKDMTMKNGTLVKTSGAIKTKDGHSYQLKEGDRIYLNGHIEGLTKPTID